jgi:acetyltransferase-like isoleucine patch superfamily enzyme
VQRLSSLLRVWRSSERNYSAAAYVLGALMCGRRSGTGPVAWVRGWPMPDLRAGRGTIELGHVGLYPGVRLHCRETGRIQIGDGTFINRQSRVLAAREVRLGARCMVSWNCAITDWAGFQAPQAFAPVVLEDEVWLGCRVTILGGTRLGRGCVVAAGSVVQGEYPAGVMLAGAPAEVVS